MSRRYQVKVLAMACDSPPAECVRGILITHANQKSSDTPGIVELHRKYTILHLISEIKSKSQTFRFIFLHCGLGQLTIATRLRPLYSMIELFRYKTTSC